MLELCCGVLFLLSNCELHITVLLHMILFQVIIIYEPTVGSLLSKGLQRLGGTVLAVVLSLICSEISNNSGRAEVYVIPILLYFGAHVLGFLRQVHNFNRLVFIVVVSLCIHSDYCESRPGNFCYILKLFI